DADHPARKLALRRLPTPLRPHIGKTPGKFLDKLAAEPVRLESGQRKLQLFGHGVNHGLYRHGMPDGMAQRGGRMAQVGWQERKVKIDVDANADDQHAL